jgi:hypothetical protein
MRGARLMDPSGEDPPVLPSAALAMADSISTERAFPTVRLAAPANPSNPHRKVLRHK